MDELLAQLNEQQLEAVLQPVDQSSLVLASAGSGKTLVLITRIVYLINQGIDPVNIAAVTFTNKASKEMRERLNLYLPPEVAQKVTMGTFHKICILMLKRFGEEIGLNRNFVIADSSDQQQVMKEVLLNYGQDASAQGVRDAISMISNIKNKMYSPSDVLEILAQNESKRYTKMTYNIYTGYQESLRRMNMLDFDDILLDAVKLLKSSLNTRSYYQSRYTHISVDEFQDVNPVQYELIRLISGKLLPTQIVPNTVLAVGDDFQSIYAFRGSNLQILMRFENHFPDSKTIKLEQNYRSTKAIVHTGNGLIKHNVKQKDKVSFTTNANGEPIQVFAASDSIEEAEFIAKEITNLVAFEGHQYKDFAILYRTNVLSREIEKALINEKIPYDIVGSTSFFGRLEIKDTVAYMRLVVNPWDDISLERIMNLTPGLGKTTIQEMKEHAQTQGITLAQSMKAYKASRKPARDGIQTLRDSLKALYHMNKQPDPDAPVSSLLESIWEVTDYPSRYKTKKSEENTSRLGNLDELLSVAKVYETTTENPTLDDFLEAAVLHPADEMEEKQDAVQMLTIHASKGLQWESVFVVGMNEEILPHRNSFTEEDGVEEERRLCYVAITRAEKRLYLTYAESRYLFGKEQRLPVSRFIEELPPESVLEVDNRYAISQHRRTS